MEKPDFLAKNNALSDNICNIIDKQNEDMASFMLLVLGDTNEPLLSKLKSFQTNASRSSTRRTGTEKAQL